MNRLLLTVAIPAFALLGCSSEHPQQAIHVSGSASVSGPDSVRVVNSEEKAYNRGTRTEVDTTRTETTPPANSDVKPVKPVDEGARTSSESVDLKTPRSGAGYFEATKESKTYLFATSDAMNRFNNGDTSVRFVEKTGPNGERFWVQADHAETLSAEYDKAHPGK
jgi:hypothetical protein